MKLLIQSTRRDGVMSKGEWHGARIRKHRTALICCPTCGKIGSLTQHTIDPDGRVFPSVHCPFTCDFHEFVKLADWKA